MAEFNFNVVDSNFSLTLVSATDTACSTVFVYKVVANQNSEVTIELNPATVEYCKYTSDGVDTAFVSTTTLLFNGSLFFSFSIQNSGIPGFFKSSQVKVIETSSGIEHVLSATRLDDSSECISIAANDDKHYTHEQGLPALVWTVQHGLDKYPTVAVTDTSDTVVVGEVTYIDVNNLTITFNASFSGEAYLN